ncbi:MAG: vitamin B12 dependent-methionine synthase activation domain-containing protein [Bacteroidales bacterium]
MELKKVDFIAEETGVDRAEILRLAGNREGELPGKREYDLDQHTRLLMDHLIVRCREVSSPQGGYAWFYRGTFQSESELELEGVRFRVGKIIARELQHAEVFSFFAVTLGPGPELLSREFIQSGNYLEGYLADLIGSSMVESLAGRIHATIKATAEKKGMKATNHYSPGYCSWEVGEQQKLFGLLPPDWCGISLSASSLMSPIKSVSGIIGIGRDVTYHPVSCTLCPMVNCQFRKKPNLV